MSNASHPKRKALTYAGHIHKLFNDHKSSLSDSTASPIQIPGQQATQTRQLGMADLYKDLSHDQQVSWNKWHYDKSIVDCKPAWADAETFKAAEKAIQEREEDFDRDTILRHQDECERLRKLRELYHQVEGYLESKIHIECLSEQSRELARKRVEEWKELGVTGGFLPEGGEFMTEELYQRIPGMETIASGGEEGQ